MKPDKQRADRGSVQIKARNGRLRLRWTYQGKAYQLALSLPDNPQSRQVARTRAAQIERDITFEQFDRTLTKYKPKAEPIPQEQPSTIAQWERWMEKQQAEGVTAQTLSNRYQTTLNLLTHFKRDISTPDDAKAFMLYLYSRQSPKTSNRNLKMLQGFCAWGLSQGWLDQNPFSDIKPIKDAKTMTDRTPFTLAELDCILATFQGHPLHRFYHDFTLTLATLGLRPSEAIGLRWKHVDLDRNTITIAESLSRNGEGSGRVRRGRKNGEVTVLPIPEHLGEMFRERFRPEIEPNALVFTAPKGRAIDDHNYSQRIWKTILTQAGIPYRSPYNLRHSFASHALEQGIDFPTVAYSLGHRNTAMVTKVYGHMVNRPRLPDLGF
jgi:integrase